MVVGFLGRLEGESVWEVLGWRSRHRGGNGLSFSRGLCKELGSQLGS